MTVSDGSASSLRQAILDANAHPGFDTIVFDIAPGGPQTISLSSPLPDVTDSVLIDGRTQPGYASKPLIQIDGGMAGPGDGLTLVAGLSTVRGVVLPSFSGNGLELRGGTNVIAGNYVGVGLDGASLGRNSGHGVHVSGDSAQNIIGGIFGEDRNVISGNTGCGILLEGIGVTTNRIIGNYIGVTASGMVRLGNGSSGVKALLSPGHVIGGAGPEHRNVISANGGSGVELEFVSNGCTVAANYIGTDPDGTLAFGNGRVGVHIASHGNRIGGPSREEGNLISANTAGGILIQYSPGGSLPAHNVVQGNFIGTDFTGINPLGNFGSGITGSFNENNQIGGTGPWPMGNVIAFNTRSGCSLMGPNPILGNSMHDNGLLGIDYAAGTPVLNDPGDTDHLQNYPIVRAVIRRAASTDFYVEFSSQANTAYRLEFFLNAHCDPSGFGEGESLIFFLEVTTDAGGNSSFWTSFPFAIDLGQVVTATATAPSGRTSEFSPCAYVVSPVRPQFTHLVASMGEGAGEMLLEMQREPNGPELSVRYATVGGTAKAGEDFAPASGLLTLAKGQTNAFAKVSLLDDNLIEGPESFQVQLSNPTNSLEIWSASVVTIEDNDGPLILQISSTLGTVALCWTTNAVGYVVEFAPALGDTAAWEPLPGTPVMTGNQWCQSALTPGSNQFYRLRKQTP